MWVVVTASWEGIDAVIGPFDTREAAEQQRQDWADGDEEYLGNSFVQSVTSVEEYGAPQRRTD